MRGAFSNRHIPRAPAPLLLCKTKMRLDSLHRTSVYSYFNFTNSYSSAHAVSLTPHECKLTRGGEHTEHAFIFITRLHPGPYIVVYLRTSVREVITNFKAMSILIQTHLKTAFSFQSALSTLAFYAFPPKMFLKSSNCACIKRNKNSLR